MTQSREERLAKKRAYYAANRDKARAWREAHREEQIMKKRAYRVIHREELRAWRVAHPEEARAPGRRWAIGNALKVRASQEKYVRENRARIRQRQKAWRRVRDFGLSPEAFELLITAQGGRCAICRVELDGAKETHVDHDHVAGAVRGILCQACNQALGLLKDDLTSLSAAIQYLKNPPARAVLGEPAIQLKFGEG